MSILNPPEPESKHNGRRVWVLIAALSMLSALPIVLVFVLRSVTFEPFKIPSGSAAPTILIGDTILIRKWAYGAKIPMTRIPMGDAILPERGDIIVFVYPGSDEGSPAEWADLPIPPFATLDYIKRVIGLPGDTVEIRGGVVFVNGEPLSQTRIAEDAFIDDQCQKYPVVEYVETAGDRQWSIWRSSHDRTFADANDFPPQTVPDDGLFVLGDNRDHSSDSRRWGFVPLSNVKGRVERILTSVDQCTSLPRRDRQWRSVKAAPAAQ
ncbi:MAG: signal peptidase I [Myxococcota bacterium]